MIKLNVGDFIRVNNELGLIGRVEDETVSCWFHLGGTMAKVKIDEVDKIAPGKVLGIIFENNYAKGSLLERALRLQEKRKTNDLIDEDDVREDVNQAIKKVEYETKGSL